MGVSRWMKNMLFFKKCERLSHAMLWIPDLYIYNTLVHLLKYVQSQSLGYVLSYTCKIVEPSNKKDQKKQKMNQNNHVWPKQNQNNHWYVNTIMYLCTKSTFLFCHNKVLKSLIKLYLEIYLSNKLFFI